MKMFSMKSILVLCLLAMWDTSVDAASQKQKRVATTRGVRKKQWRRRNEDYLQAVENSRAATSTIVTNPSTLGKGKGKGGNPNEYIYTSEDENGRTTFVVKCSEYAAAKKAAEQAADKKTGDVKMSEAKESGVTKASTGDTKATSSSKSNSNINMVRNGPDEYCEDYLNGVGGGDGGTNGDGASGEGGSSNDNTGSYLPEDNTSGVSGGSGGLASCDAIAAGNGPRSGDIESVEVKLEVVKEQGLDDEGIMSLMQADLQFHVAPEIADCTTGGDSSSAGANGGTLITDVVFEDLQEDSSGCSDLAAPEGGDCLKTIIPVTLYYDGDDTSTFERKVKDAIDAHEWNVPGLMQVGTVELDNSGVAAIAGQEAQAEDKSRIGAAAYLSIAAACLLLLLAIAMFMKRRRRDDMIKHVELADDDDTYLRDIEGESQGSDGLARVVGDEDSAYTGFDGGMDGYFAGMDSRPAHQDVHVCSSALCDVCERSRQAGVQFIPSATHMARANMPPDEPREYSADDTVAL